MSKLLRKYGKPNRIKIYRDLNHQRVSESLRQLLHRWPKLPICVGNDYSGVRLHIAILSKCMGNLNSSHNVMKNNKIHCLPQASCVVVTPCVYGGFWSRLEAN